jgi:hypothetical protein
MAGDDFGTTDIPPLSSGQLTASYTAANGGELVRSGKVVMYVSDPATGKPIDRPGDLLSVIRSARVLPDAKEHLRQAKVVANSKKQSAEPKRTPSKS